MVGYMTTINFLQMWTDLVKEEDRKKMKQRVYRLIEWMSKNEPVKELCYDTMFMLIVRRQW
jgi:hypothetical protein